MNKNILRLFEAEILKIFNWDHSASAQELDILI